MHASTSPRVFRRQPAVEPAGSGHFTAAVAHTLGGVRYFGMVWNPRVGSVSDGSSV
ncbi:bacteriorhodopsin-regulating basic protein [Halobacterium salinarum R1]|uniref:Bacteriorhodopsin-regulating basic protein n=3 Tax=Halobacterium salinarum TaxID=2242 RepID=A0A510N6Y2_HALSA|nr:bacteriorhodopsin-regulating basic protein [Halobacterium salinarum]CCM80488.1 bacteriorhodopsin-regulating basic protein [Halobacterium salinarum R1]DAC78493.1 TPA_inf: bacteriorhodopsin-regulating basic protein [Halobacterium salinarum NRC-1]